MSEADFETALTAGWAAVDPKADVVVFGEMGIANTTSAAAIAAAIYGGGGCALGRARNRCGRSGPCRETGGNRRPDWTDIATVWATRWRCFAVSADVKLQPSPRPSCGRDMNGVPVVLDGFIVTAAAAVLNAIDPGAIDHCIAGHVSDERAHREMLTELGLKPLLDLGLRLGEGSGAALALPILRGAVACHSGMATFAEAMVSDKD